MTGPGPTSRRDGAWSSDLNVTLPDGAIAGSRVLLDFRSGRGCDRARYARQGGPFGPPQAAPLTRHLAHRCASTRYTRCTRVGCWRAAGSRGSPGHPPTLPPTHPHHRPDRFARPLRGVLSVRAALSDSLRSPEGGSYKKPWCPESTRTRELNARAKPGTGFYRTRNAGSGNPAARPLVPKAASQPFGAHYREQKLFRTPTWRVGGGAG